jgi:hypothetical protein
MLARDKSSLTSTQDKTQEINMFGRAYSTGRQMTNKLTINQEDYKSVSITRTNNYFISTSHTLSFFIISYHSILFKAYKKE